MGVPTSDVGYTSPTTGRGAHEVHRDMWWQKKKEKLSSHVFLGFQAVCSPDIFPSNPGMQFFS
jgi:hypothetical protein